MPRPVVHTREQLQEMLAALGGAPLCLAWLDLDHFRELVRLRGRAEGERALRSLERTLAGELPGGSAVAHLGADEYLVLLPETAPETALLVLERVLRKFTLHRDPQWPRSVSLSAGVAAAPAHGRSFAELEDAAEAALLRGKRERRGGVTLHTPGKMVLKSNYYPRAQLDRLQQLARREGRSEAEILREALREYVRRARHEG